MDRSAGAGRWAEAPALAAMAAMLAPGRPPGERWRASAALLPVLQRSDSGGFAGRVMSAARAPLRRTEGVCSTGFRKKYGRIDHVTYFSRVDATTTVMDSHGA
jgi:hypothetical protein